MDQRCTLCGKPVVDLLSSIFLTVCLYLLLKLCLSLKQSACILSVDQPGKGNRPATDNESKQHSAVDGGSIQLQARCSDPGVTAAAGWYDGCKREENHHLSWSFPGGLQTDRNTDEVERELH